MGCPLSCGENEMPKLLEFIQQAGRVASVWSFRAEWRVRCLPLNSMGQ